MAQEPKLKTNRRARSVSKAEDPNPTPKEIEQAFLTAADEALESVQKRARDFAFANWDGRKLPEIDSSIEQGILLAKLCAHYAHIYGEPENKGAYGMILEMLLVGPEMADTVATEPFKAMYPHLPERTRLAYPQSAIRSLKKPAVA